MSDRPDAAGATASQGDITRLGLPYWARRVGVFSWLLIGFLAAVGATAVLLAATSAITGPLVIAVLLAIVFAPVVTWLCDRGVPRPLAAASVLVGLAATTAGIVYLTAAALVEEGDQLSENLDKAVDDITGWLAATPIANDLAEEVSSTLADNGPRLASGLAGGVLSAFNSVTALLSATILSLFVLYYLLKDGLDHATALGATAGEGRPWRTVIADDVVRDVRGYFRGQTLIALSNGVVIGLAAAVLGVPAALAIGVVNFFGAYVPYLGGFFGGAFAVLMGLGGGGVGLAIAMLVVTLVVNLVLENFLQPMLIGGSLNIAPLPILLATALGGMLAGLLGLVLAAPVLAIASDMGRELRKSGFFGPPSTDARPDAG